MNGYQANRPSVAAIAAMLLAAPLAWAQEAPSPAAEPDEAIVLSPFEVTAAQDTGYAASQTLAGTRIRTDLADVGSAISVVTKEFLRDVGATDSGTLLQYTTNAEVAGTRGTFAGLGNATTIDETNNLVSPGGSNRVRGLASADNTRDFYVTDIPWDSYNVDRIDIQRGPNAILFGLGSPAGIVNAQVRNAEFRNLGQIEARFGSYGSARGSFDVNQELIDNVLAIRIDALWDHEKFQQEPAFEDDERVFGAIRFDPQLFGRRDFHTSIRAKYEHGDIQANRPRIVPPRDSITPWFRPINLDPNNLDGGMGKLAVLNGYALGSSAPAFNPWLGGLVNQQQPLWLTDGTSNQLYRIYGGYVNTGALNAAGVPQGAATSIAGQRYADVFSQLTNFSNYATNARLTNYQFGQYRDRSLTDASVFDFYNQLIDGPTKNEWERWDAYNLDLSQTGFDDRLAVQLTYDRQKYNRGGQALLGFPTLGSPLSPTLNIDVLQNFQDYVVGPNNASNGNVANPNFGRPYVTGGPGRGSSNASDRQYVRGSLFGELRATDFFERDSFLAKLLGKHRFNGVYSDEKYQTENRSWQMYANSAAYSAFKLQGNIDGIITLPPVAVIYLGPSLAQADSAANANIPRIQQNITLQSGNIYQFDSTWRNPTGINLADPWNVPAGPLQNTAAAGQPAVPMFNGVPLVNPATGAAFPQLTQVSNPANYVGWNSNFHNELLRYDNGADQSLVTAAAQSLRKTKSYAGSWQGFLWNDAIVATLGWRYDEVKSKSVSAQPVVANRGALNLNPSVYRLPEVFPASQIFKDHSTAGGLVVHLNKLLDKRDFLPINVSLTYNKSNNFQVTDIRRDIFGNSIDNPTGQTKEYGVLLSTKDNKYSLRALKYETALAGANTELNNAGIYNTIRDGMNWRNIKVYYMSGYNWSTAGQTNLNPYAGQRHLWDAVYVDDASGRPVASGQAATPPANSHLETQAEANVRRDASIAGLNDLQVWLADRGYFQAWNYGAGPTTQSVLQTRAQYEANPQQPDPASLYDYRTAPLMQGFAVTADTKSEGYEFELTANPLPNWRILFNASKSTAVRTNVGGPVLDELVGYMDDAMAGAAGDMIRFNSDYSAANELRYTWAQWRGQYTLMKLQEGAAASELRKWRYNVVTNYAFRNSWLKGVGIGASYRWQDKVVIGYPVIPDPVNSNLASFDLTQPFYGPSEDAIDAWLSYERKLTSKVDWKIQLNVRNLGASNGLIPITVQPDGRTWAAARVKPVQEWFITNTFSF